MFAGSVEVFLGFINSTSSLSAGLDSNSQTASQELLIPNDVRAPLQNPFFLFQKSCFNGLIFTALIQLQ